MPRYSIASDSSARKLDIYKKKCTLTIETDFSDNLDVESDESCGINMDI
jgi:hypothetical protein